LKYSCFEVEDNEIERGEIVL